MRQKEAKLIFDALYWAAFQISDGLSRDPKYLLGPKQAAFSKAFRGKYLDIFQNLFRSKESFCERKRKRLKPFPIKIEADLIREIHDHYRQHPERAIKFWRPTGRRNCQ